MALEHLGFVELPAHRGDGGFDHAAVHGPAGRVFVAHTANDAVDVIDVDARKHVATLPGLPAVAGALIDETHGLVFTSNRGANTVGIFSAPGGEAIATVDVGIRPNGLAFDPGRGRLLVAHVGDPAIPGSCTVSIVDVRTRARIADLPVPGRTRWAVFDPAADVFHVNIMDPPRIVVVRAGDPIGISRVVTVPHAGPHGLDIDVDRRRLFCACDAAVLVEVDADTGAIVTAGRAIAEDPSSAERAVAEDPGSAGVRSVGGLGGPRRAPHHTTLAGTPDVVFFNPARGRVYVAIGTPGVIEVFDTSPLRRHETVTTEAGAHTLAFDATRNMVWAFLPLTHRAALYVERA